MEQTFMSKQWLDAGSIAVLPNPLKLSKKTLAKVQAVDDERGDRNGLWVIYRPGWKSGTDAYGAQHQDHYDTIAEARQAANGAMPCDCDECKAQSERI